MANENVFTTLGASNHAKEEREKNDFYATDNIAAHLLLENEPLKNIWECACGDGELTKVFDKAGVLGKRSDKPWIWRSRNRLPEICGGGGTET